MAAVIKNVSDDYLPSPRLAYVAESQSCLPIRTPIVPCARCPILGLHGHARRYAWLAWLRLRCCRSLCLRAAARWLLWRAERSALHRLRRRRSARKRSARVQRAAHAAR